MLIALDPTSNIVDVCSMSYARIHGVLLPLVNPHFFLLNGGRRGNWKLLQSHALRLEMRRHFRDGRVDQLPRPTLRTHKTQHRRRLSVGQGHHVLGDAEQTKRMATRNTQRTERFARVVSDTILKRKPVRNVSCGHDTLRYPLLSVAVSLCLRIPLSFSVLLPIPPLV